MTTHTETQSVAESLGGRAERQLRQMGGLSYYGDGDAQLDKQAAALLTRQQEEIERLTWQVDNWKGCFEQQNDRARKAEAERDAALQAKP